MKKVLLAFFLGLGTQMAAVAGPSHSHDHNHATDHKAMHGGLFYQAAYDYELLIKDGQALLFVTDHGKPVSLSGATAKLTILEGSKRTDIVLSPSGESLSAKTTIKPSAGAKAVVQLRVAGKSSTAKFTFP
jgi:hypothetical protein